MRKQEDWKIYPAVFTYEEGYDIAVEFPDLGVATSGKNEADALEAARELLGCAIFGLEEDGEEIPRASSLKDIHTDDNERATLIEVYMPTIRQTQLTRAVNRTVTIPAWLNSLAIERKINFSQVLQKALSDQLLES